MKKIALIVMLCLFSLFSLSACSEKESEKEETHEELGNKYEFYDPVFIREPYERLSESHGFELDDNYNNVVATIENESPLTTTSIITCHIYNQNKGKGFTLYTDMPIEKKVGASIWVRMKSPSHSHPDWSTVGIEGGDKEKNYESWISMDLNDVQEDLPPGDYRLVIFLGERNLYIETKLY